MEVFYLESSIKRVLVCEDEDAIREFIKINLERSGYYVVDVSSGEEALKEINELEKNFEIAILDIMLPGIDGFEVCKQIRKSNDNMGIVMLTAKTQEMDKVRGLMIGADDYISKPFSPSELIARIDAIYRRVKMTKNISDKNSEIIKSGPFKFNIKTKTLIKNDDIIELTAVEYQLMHIFLEKPKISIEKIQILRKIWGEDYFGDSKIVDVNIRRLRTKIEDEPSKPVFIQTVWGYGYKWTLNIQ